MDEGKGSFWTSLPGVITAIAGLLTAGAAVAALVVGTGDDGDKGSGSSPPSAGTSRPAADEVTLSKWAKQANDICEETYDDIRALGVPQDPNSQFQAIPQFTRIATRGNQRLQALERPADAEDRIDELLAAASRTNVAARNAYNAYRSGDTASAQTYFNEWKQAGEELQRIDGELGANVCAQGP